MPLSQKTRQFPESSVSAAPPNSSLTCASPAQVTGVLASFMVHSAGELVIPRWFCMTAVYSQHKPRVLFLMNDSPVAPTNFSDTIIGLSI